MEFSKLIILLSLVSLLSQPCQSTTILVDGVSEWKDPSVHVGDSVIFKHKYHYSLYIFQNQRAFSLCNFTQATLLIKPNTTSYTWHPSRPGFFYFSFNNGSVRTCQGSQKLAVKVSSTPAPESSTIAPKLPPMAAPAPTSGGVVASAPAYPWPFRPKEAAPPAQEPSASSPAIMPSLVPDKGGGIPFINSNPAVPLPTGEVDSATIRPLPISGHGRQVMVGYFGVQMAVLCMVLLML
ncbi:Cupredoxin [Trema orientale]|uniref:Cupredoxin n=1 Tax=Trema orientale TaxID=63057 RepID=A0A2P5EBV1_TREOI|nr:Cupredoxin [Trema orientale]